MRAQRTANQKEQWWERARWALDLTLDSEDPVARAVGFELLDALASSEYAEVHEAGVIDAALTPTLDAYAAQLDDHVEQVVEPDASSMTGLEAHFEEKDEGGRP